MDDCELLILREIIYVQVSDNVCLCLMLKLCGELCFFFRVFI